MDCWVSAHAARGVARMARFGVRSGSVGFARSDEDAANKRFERTCATGREHRSHLPCRRSWVRVPSSALGEFHVQFQQPEMNVSRISWHAELSTAPVVELADRLQRPGKASIELEPIRT